MPLTNWDLAVPVAVCTSLSITLHKSPLSSVGVFPHLKAGAVQLSVISNFSIDCSTKTIFSLYVQRRTNSAIISLFTKKKAKSSLNQFPCLLFLYLNKRLQVEFGGVPHFHTLRSKVTQGLVYMQISPPTDLILLFLLVTKQGITFSSSFSTISPFH